MRPSLLLLTLLLGALALPVLRTADGTRLPVVADRVDPPPLSPAGELPLAFVFSARLSGAEEVPPLAGPAAGVARYRLSQQRGAPQLTFAVRLTSLLGVAVGHIHCGDPGVKGPVLLHSHGLNAAGSDARSGLADRGVWTDASVSSAPTAVVRPVACTCQGTLLSVATLADVAQVLRRGCGYAEYHSIASPQTPTVFPGVIRGQISAQDDDEEDED